MGGLEAVGAPGCGFSVISVDDRRKRGSRMDTSSKAVACRFGGPAFAHATRDAGSAPGESRRQQQGLAGRQQWHGAWQCTTWQRSFVIQRQL